jgi:uncharacterized protein
VRLKALLRQIASPLAPRDAAAYSGPFAQSLEILVLQPTPFCNINCDYCYLPNRSDRQRMSLRTIQAAVSMVLDGGLVEGRLCIVWHAGEPLVLPVSYYEEAFAAIEQTVKGRFEISHSVQSNGTLIDGSWCEFFKQQPVRIGLSIDGPAFLHDRHRKSRQGKATHAQTMRGARELREHGIPFHVIAVVSADSLDHAEAIFRFFEEHEIHEVGFNVEELEGDHSFSSLEGNRAAERIEKFWQRLYELSESSSGSVEIREFQRAARAILTSSAEGPWEQRAQHNDLVLPFRILSVDCHGRVSTFSPELLGIRNARYNDFTFGQVGQHDLQAIRASEPFQRVATEVWRGVEACARTCEYFSVCGGGAPSNKYFENGSFASTTTMYCRTSIQLPIQVVLSGLERSLGLASQGAAPRST